MERPPAGWYVDPDPLPKAPHPVRWWDGERWTEHQAWHRFKWVRRGDRLAGLHLLDRQHPWRMGLLLQALVQAPFVISDQLDGGWDIPILLLVGWWLFSGAFTGLLAAWNGPAPSSVPPPPTQPPRGRGDGRRPLVA